MSPAFDCCAFDACRNLLSAYFFLVVTIVLLPDLAGVIVFATVLCLACAATVFTVALCLGCAATVFTVALCLAVTAVFTAAFCLAGAVVFTAALAGVETFTGVTFAGAAAFTAGVVTFTSFTDFTTGAVAANALVEPPTTLTTANTAITLLVHLIMSITSSLKVSSS